MVKIFKISGTYCASLTPFKEDYSINKKLLLDHCNNLLSQNVDGIAIFGTTGEANSLSIEEKIEAINFLIDNKIDSKKLLPGTGLNSIKDTVIFTKAVAKICVGGCDLEPEQLEQEEAYQKARAGLRGRAGNKNQYHWQSFSIVQIITTA